MKKKLWKNEKNVKIEKEKKKDYMRCGICREGEVEENRKGNKGEDAIGEGKIEREKKEDKENEKVIDKEET